MSNNKIRVAITQGDTNGIGFELIFKTFSEPEMLEICTPIIYGSPKVAAYHSKALDTDCQFTIINSANEARPGKLNLLACSNDEIKVELGHATKESSVAAAKALECALKDGREGLFDVLVCGPSEKNPFDEDTKKFHIHMNGSTRLVVACDKNIKNVTEAVTIDNITTKIRTLHASLRRDFFLSTPRIAVLALNPEEGKEENEIIAPAIAQMAEEKINAFGPYKADTFFAERQHEAFDGILAMYHDQGIIPMRMLGYGDGVVYMANVSIVCTMPDCDAQFAIAGKNNANEAVLRNAIYAGIDIFRNRDEYDRPMANPLEKLYHERPDSGEKIRFAIPKKKENSPNDLP